MSQASMSQTVGDSGIPAVDSPKFAPTLGAGVNSEPDIIPTDEDIQNQLPIDVMSDPIDMGGRPEYLLKKFESVDKQAAAYVDLEKKHKETETKYTQVKRYFGAPEDGVYTLPGLDEESTNKFLQRAGPIVEELTDFAKSHNLSQEMFGNLFERVSKQVEAKIHNTHADLETLDDAEGRVRTVQQFLKSNFKISDFPVLATLPLTKDVILFFEGVKSKMTGNTNMGVRPETIKPLTATTLEQIRKEITDNLPLYKSDEAYRARIDAKVKELEASQGHAYRVKKI